MVERYPHTATIVYRETPTLDPDQGYFTEGTEISQTVNCRITFNGQGKKIVADDGNLVDYSYLLHCPKQSFQAPFGATVNMTADTGAFKGNVKRMVNNQLSSLIWL